MKTTLRASSVALCLLMICNSASADTIDFELLNPYGNTMGPLYQEDGYTLTNNADAIFHSDGVTAISFGWWAPNYPNYLGSVALFTNYWPLTVTLTKDNSSLFDMYSIDLSRMGMNPQFGAPGIRSVNFTGVKADDSTVAQTFTYSDALALQTFFFSSDFRDMRSVSWGPASQTAGADGVGVQYYPIRQHHDVPVGRDIANARTNHSRASRPRPRRSRLLAPQAVVVFAPTTAPLRRGLSLVAAIIAPRSTRAATT